MDLLSLQENQINFEGTYKDNDKIVIKIDPRYYRPAEVEELLGDSSKAKNKLGWEAKISLEEMIAEMVEEDNKLTLRELKNNM